jgi:hypothetical protein
VTATLLYLALGELLVRMALHAPPMEWRDFRQERAAATINKAVEYDSLLGWRLKPFLKATGLNTLEYGFAPTVGPTPTSGPEACSHSVRHLLPVPR